MKSIFEGRQALRRGLSNPQSERAHRSRDARKRNSFKRRGQYLLFRRARQRDERVP